MRKFIKRCSCGAPIFRITLLGGASYTEYHCTCRNKNKLPVALRPYPLSK